MAATTDPVGTFLKERLAPYWHQFTGGFLLAVVVGVFAYLSATILKKGDLGDPAAVASGLVPTVIILAVWFIDHRFPRVPSGKVGILLAISADLDEEAKRIQTDFTIELVRRLSGGRMHRNFAVVTLPEFWVADLEASDEVTATKRIMRKNSYLR